MEKIDEVEKTREKERDQSTGICPGSRDAAAAGKCERIVGKYEDFCEYRTGGPEAVVYGSSTFFCCTWFFKYTDRYRTEL